MALFDNAFWIPVAPFAAGLLMLAAGRRLPGRGIWLSFLATAYAFVHAMMIALRFKTPGVQPFEASWPWFNADWVQFELGVYLDGMSALFTTVVAFVSLLVQVYSLGYQHGKPRLTLYYAYISLFTSGMLTLVCANNFLQAFIGWELMGLCSYLLIGFEYERPSAAEAGRKAFMTTRVGDVGFYIALLLMFSSLGTFNIGMIRQEHAAAGAIAPGLATALSLLLFLAAAGKSAQFPLHVWLPDAMEGPTPVSALIHAATMVAAGVYLVARSFFLVELSPVAPDVVAWVGGLTAFGAALSALAVSDIKKVLAYSTISQLGYMMMALGLGGVQAASFHLMTHAFFKALLFLAAGSVIHAVHTNDMFRMGGLSRRMPVTFVTFAAGAAALAGVPGFAGFFSKEAILSVAFEQKAWPLFVLGAATAGLTAFYMTRAIILTFLGDARDVDAVSHAEESGPSMAGPLLLLGLLAAGAGFAWAHVWPLSLWIPGEAAHHGGHAVLAVSLSALGLGGGLGWAMYGTGALNPRILAETWPRAAEALNKRYVDQIYSELISTLVVPVSRVAAWIDDRVVDGVFVNGAGWAAGAASRGKQWFDDVVVDGFLVNGVGRFVRTLGWGVPKLQTGAVQLYLLATIAGLGFWLVWIARSFG